MECLHLPEISLAEFGERLMGEGRHIPLTGSLEVTARCNLRCAHCYISLPAGDLSAQRHELGLREWQGIIDAVAAQGCLWLLFTGGEIFLRPDFLDIYLHAKRKGLIVTLFTNSTLITPAMADVLAEFPPLRVEITIYGRTKATYESVTRVPGSFERCREGIQRLLERKIPLALKTMVMTLNRHELGEMQSWAATLGLEFRYDPVLMPRIDGSREPCALRILPEQVVDLDITDAKRFEGWQEFIAKFSGSPAEPDRLFQCGAGEFSFHIDAYGSLTPCQMVRTPGYFLPKGSFAEGWRDFIDQSRKRKRQKENPCARCEIFSLCDLCPGWSQLELGQAEGRVEYLCRIARLRARALGVPYQEI